MMDYWIDGLLDRRGEDEFEVGGGVGASLLDELVEEGVLAIVR